MVMLGAAAIATVNAVYGETGKYAPALLLWKYLGNCCYGMLGAAINATGNAWCGDYCYGGKLKQVSL